jgi:hypothetical protein
MVKGALGIRNEQRFVIENIMFTFAQLAYNYSLWNINLWKI